MQVGVAIQVLNEASKSAACNGSPPSILDRLHATAWFR